MKLYCLGATQEVGRSAFLIEGSENILFDYGFKLNQRTKDLEEIRETEPPLDINKYLDGIVLSHAHLDHSGAIPMIYKNYNPPLFLLEPTLDLANLLWIDTIKICKYNKMPSFFSLEDIEKTNDSAFYLNYNKRIQITKKSYLTFYNAGHIIGSNISLLEMDDKKIMYTGDIRGCDSALFKSYDKNLPKVDYLITETTYGNIGHEDRIAQEKALVEDITSAIEKKKHVIIPCFAIERSQEVLMLLSKYKVDYPIYMDGMSIKATKIFLEYAEYFKDYKNFKKIVEKVKFIKNQKQREKVLKQPCIIITTAGMLEGGPVLYYIKELSYDTENIIIITGYQVENTKGDILLKTGKIEIDGDVYEPKCEITKHNFSGHADRDDLIELIKITKPKKIILIHGEFENMLSFKNYAKKLNIECIIPKLGDVIELD